MSRETYLWIGIIGQGVPILTGLYLVTVGNWIIKWRERKEGWNKLYSYKPNTPYVSHSFTIKDGILKESLKTK